MTKSARLRSETAPDETARCGDADIASVAALIADPARGRILLSLVDGRALAASVLATEAGISAQSASTHLKKLVQGNLLTVESRGRHRYYRLAGPNVATAIESLTRIARPHVVMSLRQGTRASALRTARTCYDHLAGRLGVAVTAALLDRHALERTDGYNDNSRRADDPLAAGTGTCPYRVGPHATMVFSEIGLDAEHLLAKDNSKRPLVRACVDWSEQRHHLAGRLGAAITQRWIDLGWIERRPQNRALKITSVGANELHQRLGIDLPDLVSTN